MAESLPPESWDEKTPADSLRGMRKAIKANTEAANAALNWSVKTHNIVMKIHDAVTIPERQRTISTVLISAGVSLLTSAVIAACAMGAR